MPIRLPFLLTLIFALLAGQSAAGPWPREPGQVFLSLSVEQDRNGNSHTGLFGEYGLTARHTLGFQIGYTNVGETTALMWLQRALDDGQGPHRLSVSAGAGAVERDGLVMPLGQLAVAYGRGFESVLGGGWFAVDARFMIAGDMQTLKVSNGLSQVETTYLTPEMTTKADVTLGLHPKSGMMLIGQLRLEDPRDADFSVKLATSVVHDLTGPIKLELGLVEPLKGPGERAFKLATWIAF